MQEFLLLLKGDGMNFLSPEQLQKIMADYKSWVESLDGKYLGGQRLEESGAVLTEKGGKVITDGPFLESKEIIAGFFLIAAKDQDEAIKIAAASPHAEHYTIEIRPIAFPKMS